MNLISETKKKLEWNISNLEDLKECLNKGFLSKDGIHHVREEIKKTEYSIKYYKEILEILEGNKWI